MFLVNALIAKAEKVYLSAPPKIVIIDHDKKRTFELRKEGLPDVGKMLISGLHSTVVLVLLFCLLLCMCVCVCVCVYICRVNKEATHKGPSVYICLVSILFFMQLFGTHGTGKQKRYWILGRKSTNACYV